MQDLQKMRDEKEALFVKQKEVSQLIGKYITELKQHKQSRDTLTAKVQEGKDERSKINDHIRQHIDEVKKLQGGPITAPAPVSAPQGRGGGYGRNVKPITPGSLKKEIEGIKRTIETAAVSFDKEKELMKLLKEKQKLLDKFSVSTEQKKVITEIDKKLKDLKKGSDDVHEVIQDAAKRSQEEHEAMLILSKKIDELRTQEKQLREQIAPLKEKIKDLSKSLDIPIRKPRGNSGGHHSAHSMQTAKQKKNMAAQVELVREKMQNGEKLTTEDFLILQNASDSDFPVMDDATAGSEANELRRKGKSAPAEVELDEDDDDSDELEIGEIDDLDTDEVPPKKK